MSNFEFLTLELETAELFQTANFAEKNYTGKKIMKVRLQKSGN